MAYYRYNPGNNKVMTEKYLDVFAEFDFGYVDYDCNFFCPECRNILKCEAFSEVREDWEYIYM